MLKQKDPMPNLNEESSWGLKQVTYALLAWVQEAAASVATSNCCDFHVASSSCCDWFYRCSNTNLSGPGIHAMYVALQESDALQSEVGLLTADRARLTREVRGMAST